MDKKNVFVLVSFIIGVLVGGVGGYSLNSDDTTELAGTAAQQEFNLIGVDTQAVANYLVDAYGYEVVADDFLVETAEFWATGEGLPFSEQLTAYPNLLATGAWFDTQQTPEQLAEYLVQYYEFNNENTVSLGLGAAEFDGQYVYTILYSRTN